MATETLVPCPNCGLLLQLPDHSPRNCPRCGIRMLSWQVETLPSGEQAYTVMWDRQEQEED